MAIYGRPGDLKVVRYFVDTVSLFIYIRPGRIVGSLIDTKFAMTYKLFVAKLTNEKH